MDELSLAGFAGLAIAGIGAGILNSLAGGGGMLVLPALMLLGLPADVANGTYRLSVVTHSASGTYLFRRAGKLPSGAILPIIAPTLSGALAGALAVTQIPASLLKPILLGTMVIMAAYILLRPNDLMQSGEAPLPVRESPKGLAGLFFAGFYGGFVQAGVGVVLLGVLAGILRYDLVRANALKLVITLVYGVFVLGVFVWAGQVAWLPAAVLALAAIVGSQIGVRMAIKVNPIVIRRVVLGAVVATSIAAILKG